MEENLRDEVENCYENNNLDDDFDLLDYIDEEEYCKINEFKDEAGGKNINYNKKYTKKQITDLVIEYNKTKDQKIYNEIYLYYKPILERWGIRNKDNEMACDLLDIYLYKTVGKFNPNKNASFDTFFWYCSNNYVKRNKISSNAQKRIVNKKATSLNKTINYKNESDLEIGALIEDKTLLNDTSNKELKMAIYNLKDYLKENEMLMLLALVDNYTIKEISNSLNITSSGVCMALKRLGKKCKVAENIREILS